MREPCKRLPLFCFEIKNPILFYAEWDFCYVDS